MPSLDAASAKHMLRFSFTQLLHL